MRRASFFDRRPRSSLSGALQSVPGTADEFSRTKPSRPAGPRPVIALQSIVKTYQMGDVEVRALRQVSLTVAAGDFVAIMGASGSGKSTMMNIIGCLDVPTRGRYWLDGVDVRNLDESDLSTIRNRKIGFVFQSYNLIPRTTALANVELALAYGGVKPKERQARAADALAQVGLSDRSQHIPSEMSGGQQQRVAIARALATNPALLLADEPTGNLDTVSGNEVMGIFSRLNAEGRTVVIITHEDDIASFCKRVVRLRDGQIYEDTRAVPVHSPPPLLDIQSGPAAFALGDNATIGGTP
jgi:putative ABC transport system ATP-binding protein